MKRPTLIRLTAVAAITVPLLTAATAAGASDTPSPVPAGSPAIAQQAPPDYGTGGPAYVSTSVAGVGADLSYHHWYHENHLKQVAAGLP